jgi:Ca2+-transporting ATPase
MAGPEDDHHDIDAGRARSSSTSPNPQIRRARAPTITIDTSAVSPPTPPEGLPQMNIDAASPTHEQDPPASSNNLREKNSGLSLTSGAADGRSNNSLDTSRPASAHNISSPTSRSMDRQRDGHTFLAVPGAQSRGASLEIDDNSPGTTSYGGDTLAHSGTLYSHQDVEQNANIIHDKDALTPDPGQEADFEVKDNVFAFTPGQLSKQYTPKSLSAFHALGGLKGLTKGLQTDLKAGLSSDETHVHGVVTFEEATKYASQYSDVDVTPEGEPTAEKATKTESRPQKGSSEIFADRKRVFKENKLPAKKIKSLWELAWIAYKDKILLMLSAAAVVSLALGLYQTFSPEYADQPKVEWVEGVAIIVAILIVVIVGAFNDWQKERQFAKLNKKKEDRVIKVIRSGRTQEISVYDIVVGDVIYVEPGDMIPVDGILIQGYGVKCDESSATGETNIMLKTPGDRVYRAIENHDDVRKLDPFILSGAKVQEGVGTFLVTGVGPNSVYGKTLMESREDADATPLQVKLNKLAEQIAKLGGAAALLLFVVLFIKFLAELPGNKQAPAAKGQNFLNILIVTITIVVVAVPEGLPLAVTLALAVATTRMLKDNNLVRVLRACETMGNATTICSDKTGTLTTNKMSVVAGTLGTSLRFDSRGGQAASEKSETPIDNVPIEECIAALDKTVKELYKTSIVLNSTAFEDTDATTQDKFVGSKTETALLNFAKDHLGMGPVAEERANAELVQLFPFDSGRKCMGCVEQLSTGKYRLYVKGASEILLEKADKLIADPTKGITETEMTSSNRKDLNQIITTYASRSLRTIGIVYRDFESWPPKGARFMEGTIDAAEFDDVFKSMVFISIVGIQDPLRDGVKEAVKKCSEAGVFVRMVTGDNVITAKAIAEECGIYTAGGLVLEGPVFRRMTKRQMDAAIPKLQVLARSSPQDKRILVKRLKDLGETVAVTGDGTNDGPALKMADVGFSMGIAGTEVAKEASAIILMDDNFSSIVKALMWGRAVNDSVQKFLQFQITVNITAVVLTFVSAVASNSESSVLTAVQLLWVNLIMDTFAALALATDPPSEGVLRRKPTRKSAPLITLKMWKMIIGQAIYQLVVTFILYFGGNKILSYQTPHEQAQLETLVFNTFVWMQIFNQYNNRRLDDGFNIFEGLWKNPFFVVINFIMIGGQILIVMVGSSAFAVTRLNGAQWGYSIVLGALSIPIAVVIRCLPDAFVEHLIPRRLTSRRTPEVVVSDEEAHRFEWNEGILEIREELAFVKKIRGGRLNGLKFKLQHPRELLPRSRSGSIPHTPRTESLASGDGPGSGHSPGHGERRGSSPGHSPSPSIGRHRRRRSRSNSAFGAAAVAAGVVAGSIGGWSPIERKEDLDFPMGGLDTRLDPGPTGPLPTHGVAPQGTADKEKEQEKDEHKDEKKDEKS